MLSIAIIITSILAIQTMQSAISPATLRAMATLQAHRARAVANVLRARAQYNAARARTNLGLLDHRVIRNSDDQIDDPDFDYDQDFASIDGDYDDVNLPDLDEEDIARFLPRISNSNGDGKGLENLVGANDQFANNPGPEIPCAYGDFTGNLDSKADTLGAPLTTAYDDQVVKQWHDAVPLRCQGPFELVDSPVEGVPVNVDPTLGMQPNFAQFAQPQFGQQLIFPWQVIQGIPAMQIVPQMNPYQNFPMQPMSALQPGSQMVFLRQASSQDDKDDHHDLHDHQKLNPGHTVGPNKEEDPNLGAYTHTHSHTHTHTHFKEPTQRIQVPNTQIVSPALNVHVIQNQKTEVAPKEIPAHYASVPGFSFQTPGDSYYSPNPLFNGYGVIGPYPAFINRQPNGGSANFAQSQATSNGYGNVGPGTSTQSQVIQTNGHHLLGPNPTRGGFTQSQTIQQPSYLQNSLSRTKLEQSPHSNWNGDNEKVGTVLTDSRMMPPESPDHFDPNRPQNLQPVVNYIERQEGNMKRLVQAIENNENLHHQFDAPPNIQGEEFGRSPNQYYGTIQDETLGTIPLDTIHLNPPPTLPENFYELSPEERQDVLDNYYKQGQENLRNFMEQVDENNKRNMNRLTELIETGPGKDSGENQDSEEDDLNIITRSSPYNTNPEVTSSALAKNVPQIRSGTSLDANTNLGHIIDVPENRQAEWYQRLARSLNKTDDDALNDLLLTEKEITDELKKDAEHDEDLMMIGYVGDSIIKELEKKKNDTKRTKRDILGASHTLPLNRFMLDPAARLDIPRTLDNLGAVVKNSFEHENAPLYHVRNMMGSAQDAVLATMKIPSKNFLIPSQYDIVRRQKSDDVLGDINPNVFSEKYLQESHLDKTFQNVGSAIRGGVVSGQEALSHVGQVANHAKNAIHSTRHTTPRLMLNRVPALTSGPIKNAVLIAPRMLGIANANDPVGILLDNSQGQFVKMGNILDAIGVSNPSSNDVHFQKIMIAPLSTIHSPVKPPTLENLLGNVRVEDYNGQDQILLGNTVDALEKVKASFGVDNLKDFFDSVRDKVKVVLGNNIQEEITQQNEQKTKPIVKNPMSHAHISNQGQVHPQIKDPLQNREVVAASMIPENLVHPFMGHFSQNELDQMWNQANRGQSLGKNKQDRHLGQILGAINPVMFEKLFNESLRLENSPEASQSVSHDDYGESHRGEDDEGEVGTNMAFSTAMLRPFMGQASNRLTEDFLHKYNPNAEEAETSNHERMTERAEWMEVDFEQGNGLEK